MAVKWEDLSKDEQDWLQRLYNHNTAFLTVDMANRLKSLGLAEEKLGGTGISREGKDLISRRILAARRKRQGG